MKKSNSCEKVFVLPRDKTKTFAKKGQKKLQNNVLFAKKYSKHHVWSQWKSSFRSSLPKKEKRKTEKDHLFEKHFARKV